MKNTIFWDVTLCSPLKVNRMVWHVFLLLTCSAYSILQMKAICSTETSVDFQRTTWRYMPESINLFFVVLKVINCRSVSSHAITLRDSRLSRRWLWRVDLKFSETWRRIFDRCLPTFRSSILPISSESKSKSNKQTICCLLGSTVDSVDGMSTCIRIVGKYLPGYNTGFCVPTFSGLLRLNELLVIMHSAWE
jgi:hypothetical protein